MFRAAELDHSFPFATFTRVRQLLRLGWASTARSGTRFRFRFGFRFAESGCVSSLTFLPPQIRPRATPGKLDHPARLHGVRAKKETRREKAQEGITAPESFHLPSVDIF